MSAETTSLTSLNLTTSLNSSGDLPSDLPDLVETDATFYEQNDESAKHVGFTAILDLKAQSGPPNNDSPLRVDLKAIKATGEKTSNVANNVFKPSHTLDFVKNNQRIVITLTITEKDNNGKLQQIGHAQEEWETIADVVKRTLEQAETTLGFEVKKGFVGRINASSGKFEYKNENDVVAAQADLRSNQTLHSFADQLCDIISTCPGAPVEYTRKDLPRDPSGKKVPPPQPQPAPVDVPPAEEPSFFKKIKKKLSSIFG